MIPNTLKEKESRFKFEPDYDLQALKKPRRGGGKLFKKKGEGSLGVGSIRSIKHEKSNEGGEKFGGPGHLPKIKSEDERSVFSE